MSRRRSSAHEALLSVLRARAVSLAARTHPYRKVGWPVVEAAVFVASRRGWARARTVGASSGGPSWLVAVAAAADLSARRKADRAYLAALLRVARALVAWRGGLRYEELAIVTALPERWLWATLQRAKRERLLVDLGERGWFVDTADGTGPGSVGELRRRPASAA